jgi:hypothetical protein
LEYMEIKQIVHYYEGQGELLLNCC